MLVPSRGFPQSSLPRSAVWPELVVEQDDVDVNSNGDFGRTLLSMAAAGGYETAVKLLVERDNVRREAEGLRGPDAAVDGASGRARGGSQADEIKNNI